MKRLAQLERRIDTLEEAVKSAQKDAAQYRALYLEMVERCRKLELGLLGQKSERVRPDDGQLSLSILASMLGKVPVEVE